LLAISSAESPLIYSCIASLGAKYLITVPDFPLVIDILLLPPKNNTLCKSLSASKEACISATFSSAVIISKRLFIYLTISESGLFLK
jgi:hypothetical protein